MFRAGGGGTTNADAADAVLLLLLLLVVLLLVVVLVPVELDDDELLELDVWVGEMGSTDDGCASARVPVAFSMTRLRLLGSAELSFAFAAVAAALVFLVVIWECR